MVIWLFSVTNVPCRADITDISSGCQWYLIDRSDRKDTFLTHTLEFKSFHDQNGDHPSQTLIFHNNSSSWWIKYTVDWSLPEQV